MLRMAATVLVSLVLSSAALAVDMTKVKSLHASYIANGKTLMGQINAGKVDEAQAQKLAYDMVDAAKNMSEIYGTVEKKAEKLVKMTVEAIPAMKAAKFDTLIADYHDGAALISSGIDMKKEENEKYTDAVHPLVHPLAAYDAIKRKDLKMAKEQLAEGLEQIESMLKQLSAAK